MVRPSRVRHGTRAWAGARRDAPRLRPRGVRILGSAHTYLPTRRIAKSRPSRAELHSSRPQHTEAGSAVLTTALCQLSTGDCLNATRIEDTQAAVRVGPFAIDQSYWQLYIGFRGLNVSLSVVGGTHQLHTTLGRPLAGGRLVLAGEHTSALHTGTVHGAIVAGRKAAAYVRAAARGRDVEAAGQHYEDEYTKRLFDDIYSDDDDDEEEVWDRNP